MDMFSDLKKKIKNTKPLRRKQQQHNVVFLQNHYCADNSW